MVGLTFVGLDDHRGEKCAFDAATGIIPAYRGQAIAKGMFEHILPRLRERGVTNFLLEVLKPNEAAIRAYTKTGFEPVREFACYDLLRDSYVENSLGGTTFEVQVIDKPGVQEFENLADWQPSWENSFAGMDRIPDKLIRLGAFSGEECVGVLVYYPLLQWVMCLVVKKDFRRRGVASSLLASLMQSLPGDSDRVKINNIDRSDKAMLALLEQAGATHVIDQFEMQYELR
jgi:ribosomal protein S18 acetylase RimI-like enzyme